MTESKTERQLHIRKRAEVHTPDEFIEAFDDNVVIVFGLNKDRTPAQRMQLFTEIYEANPELIVTECDLCILSTKESKAYTNQFLLIDKNGTSETKNSILSKMAKSGIVSAAYVTFHKKKNGIKRCVFEPFSPDKKVFLVKKMSLLLDDYKLIATVRNLGLADHDKLKENDSEE